MGLRLSPQDEAALEAKYGPATPKPVLAAADSDELEIWVPFPPSVNHYWRRFGNKTLISKPGREFRKTVKNLCACFRWRIEGRLDVTITLFPPDRRRRDVDNYAKSLLDALVHGGVFDDDEQIDELRIQRKQIKTLGQALVTIRKLNQETNP